VKTRQLREDRLRNYFRRQVDSRDVAWILPRYYQELISATALFLSLANIPVFSRSQRFYNSEEEIAVSYAP
jgi:hypothetical protein